MSGHEVLPRMRHPPRRLQGMIVTFRSSDNHFGYFVFQAFLPEHCAFAVDWFPIDLYLKYNHSQELVSVVFTLNMWMTSYYSGVCGRCLSGGDVETSRGPVLAGTVYPRVQVRNFR